MHNQFDFGGSVVWKPTRDYIENAHLTRFMQQHNIHSFSDLMLRSTQDVAWFSDAILKYLDIQFYEPYTRVVDLTQGIAWPKWCLDGKMNIVHNCLDKYIHTPTADHVAVIAENEAGDVQRLTYAQLWEAVTELQMPCAC